MCSYNDLIYTGQATLQAPSNVGIDTRSCSSMQVSWQAPPTLGTYTYATVAYNGGSITYRNTGQTTSSVFNDLNHLDTFIVFVVAMQGNAYGAAYDIFTLESCMCTTFVLLSTELCYFLFDMQCGYGMVYVDVKAE